MKHTVNTAGIINDSIADGPGIRLVVFCQGCPRRCHGCHNEGALEFGAGIDTDTDEIIEMFSKNPLLDGITFSGGEPFCQAEALVNIAEAAAEKNLDIVTFTGYVYEELIEMAEKDQWIKRLLDCTDLLIDGPYEEENRDLTLRFRGSSNQRIIDVKKAKNQGFPVLAEKYM